MVKHSESFGSSGTFRGVSAIQGSGLEGFHCILDFTGANNWSYCNCEISVCMLTLNFLLFRCIGSLHGGGVVWSQSFLFPVFPFLPFP